MGEGLPLGEELAWTPARPPRPTELRGTHVCVRPVDPEGDAEPLFESSHEPAIWTYLPDGPYESSGELRAALTRATASVDPLFLALVPLPAGAPAGMAAYLRIAPEHGTIEIGHIWFGTPMRRTTAATEAIYLLARHAFDDLGYRRLEWKCNALNAASRRAAERFGFLFEGIFRRHMVVKGRSRDTAWYAITDLEWPAVRQGFESWLAPENFGADGRQVRSLGELMAVSRA